MSNIKYSKTHIEQLNKQIEESFPLLYKVEKNMKTTHEGISRMVMLDRYAQKDRKLETLTVGDLVIAKIKHDPMFPTSGIAFVKEIGTNSVVLEICEEYVGQIDPSLEPEGNILVLPKSDISKPMEIFFEQIAKRVANALGEGESPEVVKNFAKEIGSLNIIPAGRVLYGAGSGTNVTYFNCFVMPMPHDSRTGISDHRKEVMEIMSRGGGVGTNGSTLRPKNAAAVAVGGTSSGAVSWLNDLASLTDLVQQGGSRRGAQMIMLQDWHPDVIEFIISKMQKPEILKWIAENFKDKHIRQLANDKLRLKPLSKWQRKALEDIVANTKDVEILKEAQQRLKVGGEYEVVWPEFLSGANISVGITKEFMQAVEDDTNYTFRFPDVENFSPEEKEIYENEWQEMGDVRLWEQRGLPVKKYRTIKAKELWDLINFCATYSAEPGVFFIDRANEETNAKAYGQKVVCTNPCGEQPLAPYSVCNLAAINLNNMVNHKTGEVLWNKLENTIRTSVRLQDNTIDKTPYFLEANKKQATGERRLGMGVMGLHDFLIWQGIRYGSKESLKTIDKTFKFIASVAYKASADLAKEKGNFDFMQDIESLLSTGYISKLPNDVKEYIKTKGGLRNSHLLTIAPTGSTGTMVGVSTGLEPYFAFKYFRSGRLGKFMEIDQKIVSEWKKLNNHTNEKLPKIFISAMELSPEAHADVQVAIQRWIDSSISKTVNAPKGYTVRQVEKIYRRLYAKGAKGGTVYVDGSRDSQVLSITKEETNEVITPLSEGSKHRLQEISERHADLPTARQDKTYGTKVGDLCPICKEGTVEDLGGCSSCTNCGAQLKCGI